MKTAEFVSPKHPDKICDQVSDAILDAHLAGDPNSRVACESLAKTGMVVVAGEITSNAKVPYVDIVRDVVREIGYTDSSMGFDGNTCAILTAIAFSTVSGPPACSSRGTINTPSTRAMNRSNGMRSTSRMMSNAAKGSSSSRSAYLVPCACATSG